MKILVCPDTFKGTLSASQAADAIEKGILKAYPDFEVKNVPMADGGYGTLDVISTNAKVVNKDVRGPLGDKISAKYLIKGKIAFIEMAQAAGLVLVKGRNPMLTTTFGVGELILDVKDCETIYVGIGGSATVDGGMGMAQALGVKFYDKNGEIEFRKGEGYSGGSLKYLERIDISGMAEINAKVIIASDVTNPLIGEKGAAVVYGPQKGATPEMVKELDKSLENYAKVLKRDVGVDVLIDGAGAAGGLGAGLIAFLKAEVRSGVDIVMDLVNFKEYLDVDLIITGEGRIDSQTAHGKTIEGITRAAKDIPVIALGGCLGKGHEEMHKLGVKVIYDVSQGKHRSMDVLKKIAFEELEKASEKVIKNFLKT